MNDKLNQILKVAKDLQNPELCLLTADYKIEGNLLQDEKKILPGVVTLQDVRVYCLSKQEIVLSEKAINPITKAVNAVKSDKYEWLNVFEDQIIAFSLLPKVD